MKRAPTIAAVAACAAVTVVAGATGDVSYIDLPSDQVEALSGLDVPLLGERGKELIESAYCPEAPGGCAAGQPEQALIAVARDIEADPGVRLRAYRALGLYPGQPAKDALEEELEALADAQPGVEQLYLRAVLEAFGEIGDATPEDMGKILPFLDYEPSQDIRAATADALRNLGCTCAADPLRAHHDKETSEQVKLAIQRALRELDEPL